MKKILPVNDKPYIRAYTEYAFVDSIMNNYYTNDLILLKARLSESIEKEWILDEQGGHIKIDKDSFSLEENYLMTSQTKHLYRPMKDEEELILQINYQQYTNLWDSVGLFFDYENAEMRDYKNHLALVGNYCGSIFLAMESGKEKLILQKNDEKKYPIFLKVKGNGSSVTFYYSIDGAEWILSGRYDIGTQHQSQRYIVGVYISLSDRQYYKWLFNNFINIRLDINDGSTLNYCNFLKRDCKNYTINPIVRFTSEKLSVLKRYKLNLWNFIVANIEEDRYIEFWLNEKYIPGLEAYQNEDFTHESMVYGYDKNEKTLNMMSIIEGKTAIYTLKYNTFLKAFKNAYRRQAGRCYLFEYKPSNSPYELDVNGIIQQLEEFCDGFNSTLNYKHLITEEAGVFGMACYDKFLNDEVSRKMFLADLRIPYVLLEHKKCMKDRIEYLISRGYLDKEQNKEIICMSQNIYEKAQIILGMIIKYRIAKRDIIVSQILHLVEELQSEERNCYRLLIRRLKAFKEVDC